MNLQETKVYYLRNTHYSDIYFMSVEQKLLKGGH